MRLAPFDSRHLDANVAELRPARLFGRALLSLRYPDGREVAHTVLLETSASLAAQVARIMSKAAAFEARHPLAVGLPVRMLDGQYYDYTTHRRTTFGELMRDPRTVAAFRAIGTPVSSAPAALSAVAQ